MFIIGLTGSIGMGKSTAAAMFRRLGVAVQDSDAAVHALMAPGGRAVPLVEGRFSGVTKDDAIDRAALGAQVFGNPAALKDLEAILHPLVAGERENFLKKQALRRAPMVVLDVPLLFETGLDRDCDLTLLVSAPHFVQEGRVLKRPGMSLEKLSRIRSQQMPDREKRQRADHVIETGLGKRPVWLEILAIVRQSVHRSGGHWPRRMHPGR